MAGYIRTYVAAVLVINFSFFSVQAQEDKSLEIGLSTGTLIYQGDLTPSPFGSGRTASAAYGISVTRRFSHVLALRGQFVTGDLRADESEYASPDWRKYRAFRFETPVKEGAMQLVVSPFGDRQKLTIYGLAGAGLAFLDIDREYGGFSHAYFPAEVTDGLQKDLDKDLPRVLPVLPMGLGLKYQLHPKWSMNIEGTYRLMFTDYLDGFSYSAEPDMNDHYISYSFGISYCPSAAGKGCPALKGGAAW